MATAANRQGFGFIASAVFFGEPLADDGVDGGLDKGGGSPLAVIGQAGIVGGDVGVVCGRGRYTTLRAATDIPW